MHEKLYSFFLILYLIILVILVVSIIWLYNAVQKHNQNYKANILNQQELFAIQLLQAKMETQELTFVSIGRELHDNIGQRLSYLKLHLGNIPPTIHTQAIQYSMDSITDCISDIRNIARSLNGEFLLANGLIKSIEEAVAQTNMLGTDTTFSIKGEPIFLNNNAEIFLYRIVQEAFSNITKHAAATHANINIEFTATQLTVVITDNGVGFNANALFKSGLLNIKSRAELLQGTCNIISVISQGTTLTICLPLSNIKNA